MPVSELSAWCFIVSAASLPGRLPTGSAVVHPCTRTNFLSIKIKKKYIYIYRRESTSRHLPPPLETRRWLRRMLVAGVGFLVANNYSTPSASRLPSRETLAAIIARGSGAAEERQRRRGSYPPMDVGGVSADPGDVVAGPGLGDGVRGKDTDGFGASATTGSVPSVTPSSTRLLWRPYPGTFARKQERGSGGGSGAPIPTSPVVAGLENLTSVPPGGRGGSAGELRGAGGGIASSSIHSGMAHSLVWV